MQAAGSRGDKGRNVRKLEGPDLLDRVVAARNLFQVRPAERRGLNRRG